MRMSAAVLAVASVVWAQAPAFEVATVKPDHSGELDQTYPRLQNGTFTAEKASLKTLLVVAYGLIDLRINGPDWLGTERYTIAAKAPEGVPDSQIMPLLQSLLKDRFHLESHFEIKEMPVYDMVVGKGGAKLTPFDPAHPPEATRKYGGSSALTGVNTTSQIADILARAAGRPVVNKTGLEGIFGWVVNYSPSSPDGTAGDSTAPDLFAAVEQQLGLRLESKKESLPILVVDHVDRVPTEN